MTLVEVHIDFRVLLDLIPRLTTAIVLLERLHIEALLRPSHPDIAIPCQLPLLQSVAIFALIEVDVCVVFGLFSSQTTGRERVALELTPGDLEVLVVVPMTFVELYIDFVFLQLGLDVQALTKARAHEVACRKAKQGQKAAQ